MRMPDFGARSFVRAFHIPFLVAFAACGGSSPMSGAPDAMSPGGVVAGIPKEAQRDGDPVRGYSALVNNGYVTCGVPASLYDTVFGEAPPSDRIADRTGKNATLPYYY